MPRFPQVHPATFWLFIYFVCDYFLHFSDRIPGYGRLRPTLLLVAVIAATLVFQYRVLLLRRYSPVFRALTALVVYVLVSWPFVEYPGSVVRANLSEFIKAVAFFFFTALIVDSPRRLGIFLLVYVAAQTIRVLEPLYMNLTSGYWGSATYLGVEGGLVQRLAGAPSDVINSNGLGFVIATAVAYLHFLLPGWGAKGKVLYVSLLPAMLYALLLTMSRGGFIALVVVLIMVIKESRHKLVILAAAGILALIGISMMSDIQKDRYLSLVGLGSEASQRTVEGRWSGMADEFELGLKRPVFGHGVGTTPEAKYHTMGRSQASHNLYAQLLIEVGLVGAGIFFWYLYTVARSILRLKATMESSRVSKSSYAYRLTQALLTVFAMYAVYSVNYYGLSQSYWYLFAGLVHATYGIITYQLDRRQLATRLSREQVAA